MYCREITTRLAGGRSMPEMRAMVVFWFLSELGSALALLVAWVGRADHPDDPLAADHLALVTDFLDRRADLHGDTPTPWRRGLPRPSNFRFRSGWAPALHL